MLNSFIESGLKSNARMVWQEGEIIYNPIDIEKSINLLYRKIYYVSKKRIKCAIACKSSLKAALYIVACWRNNNVVIPISFNYGLEHCNKIIDLVEPDIILTDDVQSCEQFNKKCVNLYREDKVIHIKSQVDEILQDVALIMCTSGTTGNPKGVMLTEQGVICNVLGIAKYFNISSDDKILIARPLYHAAVMIGEFLLSIHKGCSIKFYNGEYDPFSIVKLLPDISVLCATPTLFRQLAYYCGHVGKTFRLSAIAISGECLDKQTANLIESVFIDTPIYNVYGLTEAGPRVSYLPANKFHVKSESVGIPLDETEVLVCDKNMNIIEGKESGAIYVKSKSVMKGYYRNKELTEASFFRGYLRTGDIGYKDVEGNLYIISREDDMINKAGMNIYPKEVEEYIKQFEGVSDCVVYGVKKKGTMIIGCDIVCKNNYKIKRTELLNTIPDYLKPNIINFVNELERNASGKIVRKKKR
ncbi:MULTISPECIES: class I adenylate-forming enzyme family protein [Blautia]|uniref:class I adenylate-forming enzyme family protein n=1 Tax=Blautia TaxID=572511 RepID=UPI000BA37F18|nr:MULTISPECIES: class I adenylate-forming enzyme family protein [Blautia]